MFHIRGAILAKLSLTDYLNQAISLTYNYTLLDRLIGGPWPLLVPLAPPLIMDEFYMHRRSQMMPSLALSETFKGWMDGRRRPLPRGMRRDVGGKRPHVLDF
jgi:hypothetical protein